jgi:hypothetical protein
MPSRNTGTYNNDEWRDLCEDCMNPPSNAQLAARVKILEMQVALLLKKAGLLTP